MSEKNFYNNYEYQDDYEMRCDCKYDYDDEKRPDECECNPEGNCCNGVTFDDPIVNKDVIISTNEVFDNKLTCAIPVTATIAAVSTSTATTIITQRYVPIEECGCKNCEPLTIDASAVYKVEKVTIKITKLFISQATADGEVLINDDPENPPFLTPDINTDVYKVSFLGFPSVFKNICDKRCKGSKNSITLSGLVFPYTPIVEICGTVLACGRKAKFFITIQLPQRNTPAITAYIPEICVPSLEAFEKPYLELSGRAEATVLGKPTVTVVTPAGTTPCLPKLSISSITFLLRGVVQSKVVVPVQRLIQSKGLFIPDNFEQCCNIPNVYPSQVEDHC